MNNVNKDEIKIKDLETVYTDRRKVFEELFSCEANRGAAPQAKHFVRAVIPYREVY